MPTAVRVNIVRASQPSQATLSNGAWHKMQAGTELIDTGADYDPTGYNVSMGNGAIWMNVHCKKNSTIDQQHYVGIGKNGTAQISFQNGKANGSEYSHNGCFFRLQTTPTDTWQAMYYNFSGNNQYNAGSHFDAVIFEET